MKSEEKTPRAWVQWKGTDVCMDFHCKCGAHCHFDGYFAYAVKCPHCGAVWVMPLDLFPTEPDESNKDDWYVKEPVNLEPDGASQSCEPKTVSKG